MSEKNIAIKVENLSKCYRIGVKDGLHDNFVHTVIDWIKSPLKNFRKYRSLYDFNDINLESYEERPDILWALKGVSFEVQKGEVVGIIGFNGAGKSTLLKILSKITAPTSGRATIHGRIASLLEVGTGFHPELTGRENIYLNGTILGMRKKEIDTKFETIVEFSGMEKFIETPVKRYSSGMKVRLAFAVAAHLDPEILLIDEVLAVGDARFQKKCMDKMNEVSQHGRTVLFVSHNMPAVTRLCPRVILLNGGRVQVDDVSHRVVSVYLETEKSTKSERQWGFEEAPGDDIVRLSSVSIRNKDGEISDAVKITEPANLEMVYHALKPGYDFMVYFHLYNDQGIKVFTSLENDPSWRRKIRPIGRYRSVARIPGNLLSEGLFFISVGIYTLNPNIRRVKAPDAVAMHIIDDMEGHGARGDWAGNFAGVIRPLFHWETKMELEPSNDATKASSVH